ncbi:MAG: ShlB/FhaC/HecB family hemolysin secretion/activation protein [Loktanella sp.]|nr:ShlB/FhaC/HecB family hemolysin secretion/activation protein [Loktanella sp.]
MIQRIRTAALAIALAALLWPFAAHAQTFSISGVELDASDYLGPEEFDAITGGYVNRPISFADLQAMIAEINDAYLSAGVVTALAILPPQEIRNGILQVRLVEARIDTVDVSALQTTREDFMRANISLIEGEKPDYDQLEIDLRTFEIAHDFRPVLSFGPGEAEGMASAFISGEEPARYQQTLSADNFGSASTGEARLSYFGRWNSVSGVRDTLSLQLQVSEGAYSIGTGYSRPVGPGGGRVIGSLTYADSEVIFGPFAPINIVSNSASANLAYSRPFWVAPDRYWQVTAGLGYEFSSSTLSDTDLLETDLVEVNITTRYQRNFPQADMNIVLGLTIGEADAADTSETEGDYWFLTGGASYVQRFAEDFSFTVSATGQYGVDQNLPPARLFNAGGPTSVRGYPNGVRSGDSGLVVQTQISRREYQIDAFGGMTAAPFGFLDTAIVVPFRVDGSIDSEQDYLASAGGGAVMRFQNDVSATFFVGVPLVETLGFDATGQAEVYLGVDWNF